MCRFGIESHKYRNSMRTDITPQTSTSVLSASVPFLVRAAGTRRDLPPAPCGETSDAPPPVPSPVKLVPPAHPEAFGLPSFLPFDLNEPTTRADAFPTTIADAFTPMPTHHVLASAPPLLSPMVELAKSIQVGVPDDASDATAANVIMTTTAAKMCIINGSLKDKNADAKLLKESAEKSSDPFELYRRIQQINADIEALNAEKALCVETMCKVQACLVAI